MVKNLPASAVDTGSIPAQGRSYMPGQLSPFAEASMPRACALQQEKSPQ